MISYKNTCISSNKREGSLDMRGTFQQSSKNSLSMRMTPSLKNQTSFDNKSPIAPNNMRQLLNSEIPNFDNKRNTPNFNHISFDKEPSNKSTRHVQNASKKTLRDMVNTERSNRSSRQITNINLHHSVQSPNEMEQSNQDLVRAPRNTLMVKQHNLRVRQREKNHETNLYESNNTYTCKESSTEEKMDITAELRNFEKRDRPNRETDLMEMDFDFDPEAKSASSENEEDPKDRQSESNESKSMSYKTESIEQNSDQKTEKTKENIIFDKRFKKNMDKKNNFSIKNDDFNQRQNDKKSVSEMRSFVPGPDFKLPAKSDGNATLGQRSFVTSSKLSSQADYKDSKYEYNTSDLLYRCVYEEKHYSSVQKPAVLKINIQSFSRKKLEREKIKEVQKNQENQSHNFGIPGMYMQEIASEERGSNVFTDRTRKFGVMAGKSKTGRGAVKSIFFIPFLHFFLYTSYIFFVFIFEYFQYKFLKVSQMSNY